jgi:predicted TIM-barrel fold metal-dependent hydrolase
VTFAVVGMPRERWEDGGTTFEQMRPGCYDPAERIRDMDVNGIEMSMCFPNVLPRFCGQTFLEARDKDLALLCVKAYNDWMADEWAGPSAGRLIHCSIVPLWDPALAAAEVRRNAARGGRAVSFSELPAAMGLPSIHSGHWDPFFDACNDTATAVCLHIGSSSKWTTTSQDAPYIMAGMLLSTNAMVSMSDWLFSGIFERFPNLKVTYSEGNIGWIPYILERADRYWEMQTHAYDRELMKRRPSEYYADHVFGSYISDQHGLESLKAVGEDNVMFETDYPHSDGTWPNSIDVARRELAHLTPLQRQKVLRLNAIRMLSLDIDQSVAA